VTDQGQAPSHPAGYEPPQVERVLPPPELEQEILYAGQGVTGDAG
jgi:hypothetical protein